MVGYLFASAWNVRGVDSISTLSKACHSWNSICVRSHTRRQQTAKEVARTKQENEFLAKKLKEKTRLLNEELTSRELKYDDLEFDEGDDGILGEGAFGIVRRATFLGEVSRVRSETRKSQPIDSSNVQAHLALDYDRRWR